MKKWYVLLCGLLLVGCSHVERESLHISNAKFIANVYTREGADYLAVLDKNGQLLENIYFGKGTYPSSAAIVDSSIYWQTLKSVTSNVVREFVNIPNLYEYTTPFHFNDVIKVAKSKVMFKNGIYDTLTGKYWDTKNGNILLCDWVDDTTVLAVTPKGIVQYDATLRHKKILKDNELKTYYEVAISHDKEKVAYLVYDNKLGNDYLMIANSDFSDEQTIVDFKDYGLLSISNITWGSNGTLFFQGNGPLADIYQITKEFNQVLNITNTPAESEIIASFDLASSSLCFFCARENSMGSFDLNTGKISAGIKLNADNVISVSALY